MKNSRIEAVIFDLDGTLLDTAADLATAVNHALAIHDMPQRSKAEILTMVGQGVHVLIAQAVPPNTSESLQGSVLEAFRSYYALHMGEKTVEFEGVPELLDELSARGLALAVVSNKPHEAVVSLIESFFPHTFSAVFGQSDRFPRKPDPASARAALHNLSVTSQRALYVGDSEVDVQTAAAAHIRFIAVEWGFRTREDLEAAGASMIISKPNEVLEQLV